MNKIWPYFIILLFGGICGSVQQQSGYEVYYEWKQIDFKFPSDAIREQLLKSGGFIQKNVVPTGIKILGDKMFLATPRYFPGVPSSLNVVPYKKTFLDSVLGSRTGPKLTPFPSYEMQEEGNCSALQLVQAMEVDMYSRLWVVDAGRSALLTPNPRNSCPAKIVIFNLLNNNRIERKYEFPNSVVPRDSNAIKDIQVACTSRRNCFAFISNINGTYSIVVYDYKNNDSWYATHPTMQPNLAFANVTIQGDSTIAPFGITGLGLTPKSTNFSRIYFSKIAGVRIYSVPTTALKNRALKNNPVLGNVVVSDIGRKRSGQSDGTAMDNRGRWFYGSLPTSSIFSLDTWSNPVNATRANRLLSNPRDFQWPDTFTFDGMGNLAFTSTRFQLFSTLRINPAQVNYRVIRFKTNSVSYQYPK